MEKKIGREIGILMGLSMSFVLSLIGMVSAGQFTVRGFLLSFVISFAISLLIGMVIPMKKISDSVIAGCKARPGSLKARILEALVTDVLFSPLMTFIMVFMAHKNATAHGARIPFGPMLLKAELISFVAAFILGFLLAPVWTGLVLKKNGINPGGKPKN